MKATAREWLMGRCIYDVSQERLDAASDEQDGWPLVHPADGAITGWLPPGGEDDVVFGLTADGRNVIVAIDEEPTGDMCEVAIDRDQAIEAGLLEPTDAR